MRSSVSMHDPPAERQGQQKRQAGNWRIIPAPDRLSGGTGVHRRDKSGHCYVVDSEVGDDPGAFGNGDNRTGPDQLLALDGGGQPPSLGMGPPRAGIKVPQDE
jgi:hypothetical protein